jgi:hypothetical protein
MMDTREPGWILNSLPPEKRDEVIALVQKGLRELKQENEYKDRLRKALMKRDRPLESESSTLSNMSGCIISFLVPTTLGAIYFLEPSKQTGYAMLTVLLLAMAGVKMAALSSEKKHKAWLVKQPKASELVNQLIRKDYNSFKFNNPGKLFGGATDEKGSVAAHRASWKNDHGFNIEGFE